MASETGFALSNLFLCAGFSSTLGLTHFNVVGAGQVREDPVTRDVPPTVGCVRPILAYRFFNAPHVVANFPFGSTATTIPPMVRL